MKNGTITRLIARSGNSDSAVARLWSFYRSRLLKKSQSVCPHNALDTPEAIANAAFSDAIRWARRRAETPRNRNDMWDALSMSAFRQGLRLREYQSAKNRITCYESLEDSVSFQHEPEIELEDELAALEAVDRDALAIVRLLACNYPTEEIAGYFECSTRTMFRRVARIKEALKARLSC